MRAVSLRANTMSDQNREIKRLLKSLPLPPAREDEIVEELSQHLEDRYQDLLTAGEDAATAAQTALDELRCGGILVEQLEKVQLRVSGPKGKRHIMWGIWPALIIVVTLGLMYWRTGNTSKSVNPSAIWLSASPPQVVIADADRDAVENHQGCA